MKQQRFTPRLSHLSACTLAALATMVSGQLGATTLANEPLSTQASASRIKHNLMFVLDNSGSMSWDFTPDWITARKSVVGRNSGTVVCKYPSATAQPGNFCLYGMPPFYSSDVNSQYYNPEITYALPKRADGSTYPAVTAANTANWTQVKVDGFGIQNTPYSWTLSDGRVVTTTNLINGYPDAGYGNGGATRNVAGANGDFGDYVYPTDRVTYQGTYFDRPAFYFRLEPKSSLYCTNNLEQCQERTSPDTIYTTKVKFLWCKNPTASNNNDCRGRRDDSTYIYPSFFRATGGVKFHRVDIVPNKTFPAAASRTDCNAATKTCSYDQEMANFATWYTYYRSRMQTMKSAASLAFNAVDDRFRIGFMAINTTSYLGLDAFGGTQRSSWYDWLFAAVPNGGTPLRSALSKTGLYYAGKLDSSKPIQYACQKNFTLLTTDGYWNGAAGVNLANQTLSQSYDADASKQKFGIYEGPNPTSDTLADVAAYYYQTDLLDENAFTAEADKTRAANKYGEPLAEEASTAGDDEKKKAQRMTTFTLGLGVDGQLSYRPTYKTDKVGDFYDITQGTRNWPAAQPDSDSAVDDLWHAAVNGRGSYQSAKQPQQVVQALQKILSEASKSTGAGGSPSFSSDEAELVPSSYATSYATGTWTGTLTARKVSQVADQLDLKFDTVPEWSAHTLLDAMNTAAAPAGASTGRTIFTLQNGAKFDFLDATLDGTARAWFSNKSGQLSQLVGSPDQTRKSLADKSEEMINYLRGSKVSELSEDGQSGAFRRRESLLGDIINSTPILIAEPARNYTDPGYLTALPSAPTSDQGFKINKKDRPPVVYVGANDGMLHAFADKANTTHGKPAGTELWAYVPRMVMPNMYRLASEDYSNNHRYFVNGELKTDDVWDPDNRIWRTIIVSGLGGGGKGYYALDVTDPLKPIPLWEFCGDSATCSGDYYDADMGYSIGSPQITKLPMTSAYPGRWVVMAPSGYSNNNNSQPATLFVLDAVTGKKLYELRDTNAGNGMAHIALFSDDPRVDNTSTLAYGGDLDGNVWKFDFTKTTPTVARIAQLTRKNEKNVQVKQPITVQPRLSMCSDRRILMFGTGQYLGEPDLTNRDVQSVYAFADDIPAADQSLNGHSKMVKRTFDYTKNAKGEYAKGQLPKETTTKLDWGTQNGWYMDLNPAGGERVIETAVQSVLGAGWFALIGQTPVQANANPNMCAQGATSVIYQFDNCSGALTQDPYVSERMIVGLKVIVVRYSYIDPTSGKVVQTDQRGEVPFGKLPSGDPVKLFPSLPPGASKSLRAIRASWREILPD